MKILGIPDPAIWGCYFLCIAAGVFCVFYGFVNWNTGDEEVRPEDVRWVKDEKEVEEDL